MQTIKLGSSGADVTVWQNDLNGAGFQVAVTGTFDDATDAATKQWQSSKGLTADGIVGPMSWSKMTGTTVLTKTDPRDKEGREALLIAWPKVTGETPSLAELQIAGAQGKLESGYGHGTYKLLDHATGQVLASSGTIWNWGAIQGGNSADGTGFLATDTGPSHITADNPKGYYDHHYRIYPDSASGAEAIVKEMTIRRPTSWALMKTGDIDAWAQQMWAGKLPDGTLNKDPQSGVLGYFEQKPDQRAKGIETHVASIAATMGEPIAAKRGGPMPPGGLETPPGQDGGGGLVWTPDTPEGQVGLIALLGGLGLVGWRFYSGHWPWPGKFPF